MARLTTLAAIAILGGMVMVEVAEAQRTRSPIERRLRPGKGFFKKSARPSRGNFNPFSVFQSTPRYTVQSTPRYSAPRTYSRTVVPSQPGVVYYQNGVPRRTVNPTVTNPIVNSGRVVSSSPCPCPQPTVSAPASPVVIQRPQPVSRTTESNGSGESVGEE